MPARPGRVDHALSGGAARSAQPLRHRGSPLGTGEAVHSHRHRRQHPGSRRGRKRAYDRILASIPALYEQTTAHYEDLDKSTLSIATPDARLDTAFRWAKIGIDKGLATNPTLGTGLLAGFRTAGDSERPGYAWFFGRDSLWTALATTAEGSFDTTRHALEFLRKFQRADGKIPHEISQSASLIPWFDQFPYPWASADATPLYVIAHADYWRTSGDRAFIAAAWPSIVKAYQFSAATDTDGNALIENSNVGHGWVEGGALYPVHEELYMQGLWVAASRGMGELADAMHDDRNAALARTSAERTRAAMEQTYWLGDRGFYAFATSPKASAKREAEPGPNRERRQARMDALAGARLIDEDTVLPAVPLWFGTMQDDRAQPQLDHLGAATIATDWGDRILSNASDLYDPLSYHYGSVWPLFTGWTAVGAYRYGRPHIGFSALSANVLLTWPGALGYVTELLSGDFATPFGRSSHHQIWSEAMIVSPVVKGLLGIEPTDGGRTLRFAPALPASWNHVDVHGVHAGESIYDLAVARTSGQLTVRVTQSKIPVRRSGHRPADRGACPSPGCARAPGRSQSLAGSTRGHANRRCAASTDRRRRSAGRGSGLFLRRGNRGRERSGSTRSPAPRTKGCESCARRRTTVRCTCSSRVGANVPARSASALRAAQQQPTASRCWRRAGRCNGSRFGSTAGRTSTCAGTSRFH